MPASRTPRSFSPTTLVAMAVLVFWTLFAGGGGWWLVRLAYQRFVEQEMLNSAGQLAALLSAGSASGAPAAARPLNLAEALLWNPHLAYAIVWAEDGAVLRHTRGELVGTYLDVTKWPPLEGGAAQRFSHLNPGGSGAVTNTPGEVLDLTIALPTPLPGAAPGARPVYLSLAYPRAWIDEQFWPFARRPLLYVMGFIVLRMPDSHAHHSACLPPAGCVRGARSNKPPGPAPASSRSAACWPACWPMRSARL